MQYTTELLRQAFIDRMASLGTPMEKVKHGFNGRALRELYRRSDGKLIRLQANRKTALMSPANRADSDASLTIEGPQDFVGLACPTPDRKGIDCYLIPSNLAIADLRAAHEAWRQDRPGATSKLRVIHFDKKSGKPSHGFAVRYAEYRLDAPELAEHRPAVPVVSRARVMGHNDLEHEIAESKRRIAALAGRPESAVTISIVW